MTEVIGTQAARYVWRRTGKRLIEGLRALPRTVRNALRRFLIRADYDRWSSPLGLENWWDDRTRRLAQMVPSGSRVIEFGAGRRQLEQLLPDGCSYVPSDLVDRGSGTIVCNLNDRPLPGLQHVQADVAVFGGVLEYIRDVRGVVEWLSACGISCCVASYESVPPDLKLSQRLRETLRRTYFGYMSSLSEDELIREFTRHNYTLDRRETWTTQGIYRFVRRA